MKPIILGGPGNLAPIARGTVSPAHSIIFTSSEDPIRKHEMTGKIPAHRCFYFRTSGDNGPVRELRNGSAPTVEE